MNRWREAELKGQGERRVNVNWGGRREQQTVSKQLVTDILLMFVFQLEMISSEKLSTIIIFVWACVCAQKAQGKGEVG